MPPPRKSQPTWMSREEVRRGIVTDIVTSVYFSSENVIKDDQFYIIIMTHHDTICCFQF
jgi:hypothetical protein